jgi:hypothetical protein
MITAHVPPFATVDRKPQPAQPRPVTAELRNVSRRTNSPWRPYDHLSGDIYNDNRSRFRDGERVSTSAIVSIDGDIVTTRNSVYRVTSWDSAKPVNDNAPADPAGGVQSPDERPGDYLMAVPQFNADSVEQEALAIKISNEICNGARPDAVQVLEWAEALYQTDAAVTAPPGVTPAPTDARYPPPVKADLVTFWMRGDAAVMSVVSEGKVKDYEVPLNVLAAGARYAIERLMTITTGRAA